MTHSFFDKLVRQLERGFGEMDKDYAGMLLPVQPPPSAAHAPAGAGEASSSGVGGSGSGPSTRSRPSSGAGAAAAAAAGSLRRGGSGGSKRSHGSGGGGGEELDPVTGRPLGSQGWWACAHCTFIVQDMSADTCCLCGLPRAE